MSRQSAILGTAIQTKDTRLVDELSQKAVPSRLINYPPQFLLKPLFPAITVVFHIPPIDDAGLSTYDVILRFLFIIKLLDHGLDALISPIVVGMDDERIKVALIDVDESRR